ncbi:restriction endonuclease [Sphingomonas metalli]|uniref:Restriction endonuclease n=1 Tax=Sphingomonas metalli TaxID=1779358 RepID=A0A916TEQ1_9SPHN|nr:HNH endonuclease [Sphingomonas metalli]GGB39784.1 restriction endonuclease [Sphingomonas metalli]
MPDMKGVFEISGTSRYDDLIAERYHFPSNYLTVARACVGDWIVYRETGAAGGRMAYVAAALVTVIDPDPVRPGLHYARVADFVEFDRPVPYRGTDGRFAERMLRDLARPADAGRALRGRSVRPIDDVDFASIVDTGLSDTLALENAIRLELDRSHLDPETLALLSSPPDPRRTVAVLLNRKVRAAAFRGHVLHAYDNRCAVTGLRIVNGGGKAEAQAAHIWSVAEGGPDTVQNGIALSATAHWLFDRHLISLDEDLRLLVSHNKVPRELTALFPSPGASIGVPADPRLRPRREYVDRHRARFAGLDA